MSEFLRHGPLGFPVVDVSVTLTTGQFHAVDSSDQAFKTCARMAMTEAMPKCEPVLLEPIHHVEIAVPNAFTSRVQRLVSGRRGQILGYDAKPDWDGWDVVAAQLPQSELHDLIVELRSVTLGRRHLCRPLRPSPGAHRQARREGHGDAGRAGGTVTFARPPANR